MYFGHRSVGRRFDLLSNCLYSRSAGIKVSELISAPDPRMLPPQSDVTTLLVASSQGDSEALDKLLPLVYSELRRLAERYLHKERPDHTLQATALVHEAYLRLIDQDVSWQNRAHFFGVAAEIMRRILIDHARKHQAAKRGSGGLKLSLDEAIDLTDERAAELIALDDALRFLWHCRRRLPVQRLITSGSAGIRTATRPLKSMTWPT